LILGMSAPTAVVALQAADYLLEVLPPDMLESLKQGGHCPCSQIGATAFALAFTLTHCLGQRESSWVQIATSAFKIATLVALGVGRRLPAGDGRLLAHQHDAAVRLRPGRGRPHDRRAAAAVPQARPGADVPGPGRAGPRLRAGRRPGPAGDGQRVPAARTAGGV